MKNVFKVFVACSVLGSVSDSALSSSSSQSPSLFQDQGGYKPRLQIRGSLTVDQNDFSGRQSSRKFSAQNNAERERQMGERDQRQNLDSYKACGLAFCCYIGYKGYRFLESRIGCENTLFMCLGLVSYMLPTLSIFF